MKLFDFDKLIQTLTGYVETKIELLKLEAKEGLSILVTKLVFFTMIGLAGFFIMLFSFLGIAAVLNAELESHFWGYLIVAGFFMFVLILILIFKDKLAPSLKEKVISVKESLEEELSQLAD